MNQLNQHIEALIFCSEQSISIDEILGSLKLSFDWEPSESEVLTALEEIKTKYQSDDFAFELIEVSEGYQFLSKKEFHATITALIQHKSRKKLSIAQMETLSIIAYKQPVAKSVVEHIRGVNCDYAIQKLLEKELIEIAGRSESPGRPVLYSTSKNFMDYFGIKSVRDLPQLKDLHMEQNEIGLPEEYMESEEVLGENVNESERTHPEIPLNAEMNDEETVVLQDNLSSDSNEEIPSVLGEDDDMPLPDRKTIFLENQESNEAEVTKNIRGINEDFDPS